MAEPFKNMFNEQFFDLFTKDLKLVIDDFDACEFVSQVMDDEWEGRELKQRCMYGRINQWRTEEEICPADNQ